ncbi:Mariner Mos1 transposase [Eumeta japonica]|uniref:Mariner Mos1 transposase n=1 Tax=Eumeta variegata TaxID=151549 RepID=A0A4C1Z4Q2_EUMVA|nr:Mariner Mos1 transposase [Eumeta japonica]
MLCVWWDWKGIIHKELLPPGKAINWDLYRRQLKRLKQEVEKIRPVSINRKGVVFHHDNAIPYTSLVIQQILKEFGWEVLMHPPHSPDFEPSHFHLFRSLQNSRGSVRLISKDDCQNYLSQFFIQKSQNFNTSGIVLLPTKKQVVEQ